MLHVSFFRLAGRLDDAIGAGGEFRKTLCDRLIDPDGVHAAAEVSDRWWERPSVDGVSAVATAGLILEREGRPAAARQVEEVVGELLTPGGRWAEAPQPRDSGEGPDVTGDVEGRYKAGRDAIDAAVRVLVQLQRPAPRHRARVGVMHCTTEVSLKLPRAAPLRPPPTPVVLRQASVAPPPPPSKLLPASDPLSTGSHQVPAWAQWLESESARPGDEDGKAVAAIMDPRVLAGYLLRLRPKLSDAVSISEKEVVREALDCVAGRSGGLLGLNTESGAFVFTDAKVAAPGLSPAAIRSAVKPCAELGGLLHRLQNFAASHTASATLSSVGRCVDAKVAACRRRVLTTDCPGVLWLRPACEVPLREARAAAQVLLTDPPPSACVLMQRLFDAVHVADSQGRDELREWLLELLRAALAPALAAANALMHGRDHGGLLEGSAAPRWEGEPLPPFLNSVIAHAASAAENVRDVKTLEPQHPVTQMVSTELPPAGWGAAQLQTTTQAIPALPSLPGMRFGRPSILTGGEEKALPGGGALSPLAANSLDLSLAAAKRVGVGVAHVAAVRRERSEAEERRRAELEQRREEERQRLAAEELARHPPLPVDWPGSLRYVPPPPPQRRLPPAPPSAAPPKSDRHPLGTSITENPALLAAARQQVIQEYADKVSALESRTGVRRRQGKKLIDEEEFSEAQGTRRKVRVVQTTASHHAQTLKLFDWDYGTPSKPTKAAPAPTEQSQAPEPKRAEHSWCGLPKDGGGSQAAEEAAAAPAPQPAAGAAAAAPAEAAPTSPAPAASPNTRGLHNKHTAVVMGDEYGKPASQRRAVAGGHEDSAHHHLKHSVILGEDAPQAPPKPPPSQQQALPKRKRRPGAGRGRAAAPKRRRTAEESPGERERARKVRMGVLLLPTVFSDTPYSWGPQVRGEDKEAEAKEDYDSPSSSDEKPYSHPMAAAALANQRSPPCEEDEQATALGRLKALLRDLRATQRAQDDTPQTPSKDPSVQASTSVVPRVQRDVDGHSGNLWTMRQLRNADFRHLLPEELQRADTRIPAPLAVTATLRRAAAAQRSAVVDAARETMLRTSGLPQHTIALHSVFLATDGSFLGKVVDAVAGDQRPPSESLMDINAALRGLCLGGEVMDCFKVVTTRERLYRSGDAADLGYAIRYTPPPGVIARVLPETTLRSLRQAHRMLVFLRRAIRSATVCLRTLARPPFYLRNKNRRGTNPLVTRLCAARWEVQCLLQSIHDHAADGLRTASSRFLSVLSDRSHVDHPKSFEGYQRVCATFSEGVRRYTWQVPSLQLQKAHLDRAVAMALELPGQAEAALQGALPEQTLAERELRVRRLRRHLVSELAGLASGTGELANAEDPLEGPDLAGWPNRQEWARLLLGRLAQWSRR
eukprot:Hpha_TRINITY_DN15607_c0_g13::TRINITY_DN15607_c0_g13_i1::g.99574::m.99574